MKTRTPLLTMALGTLFGSALAQTPATTNKPAATGGTSPAPASPAPLSDAEASRLFGLTLGEQLRGLGLQDGSRIEEIERGLKEGLSGQKSSPEERRHLQEYVRSSLLAQSERNRQAAQDFLAKNAKEKGVHTTASGLEYKVLRAGDAKAPSPQLTDKVKVQYRGKLLDGTEFDSSYARGQPAEFPLGNMIKGWQEGLALMKPGATYQLFVPPDLAYGPNPRPGIPGNSLLIFEVELLGIEPQPGAQAPPPASKSSAMGPPSSQARAPAPGSQPAVAQPAGAQPAAAQPTVRSTTQP